MRESRFWLLHLLSGAALAVLLGLHLAVMHLDGLLGDGEPISFASVAARGESAAWRVFYLVFLAVALYHGFYGLRGVLLEAFREGAGRAITTALVLVGAAAFLFGSYVILAA